ncbi:unnamed protein product [Cylicostephanus goldi]|uniref:Uncharacterized protein n=1 Tax=Cylicostephanus goldi TaxID=71465 RepID=A0A3P7M8N2_CYLGO|nr:unnamed protein product [Cylicostephanus goldi]
MEARRLCSKQVCNYQKQFTFSLTFAACRGGEHGVASIAQLAYVDSNGDVNVFVYNPVSFLCLMKASDDHLFDICRSNVLLRRV